MALYEGVGVVDLSTPKKRNGVFFTKTPMEDLQQSGTPQSFVFRNKQYASPSVALEAYISSELGKERLQSKQDDVENLLSGTFDTVRLPSRSNIRSRNGLDEIHSQRNVSIHQMVDKAFKQLQAIKKQSVNEVLAASETTLNKIAVDNLSSLASTVDSQLSTASTSSLVPNAPDVSKKEQSAYSLPSKESTSRQRRYPLNSSLEQLKKSLIEKDKENLLASHLTCKALGTLAKLKKDKSRSRTQFVPSESDDLSDQLQRLRDDLHDNYGKEKDPGMVRMSGKLKVAPVTEESTKNHHSKRSRTVNRQSRDDSYLDYIKDHKQNLRTEKSGGSHYEWPVRGARSIPEQSRRGPPSWVEDLANTEISSVVNIDFGDELTLSAGQALSLDDLSDSYRRNKEPSRVFRGKKNRDGANSGVDAIFRSELAYQSVKTEGDTDFDVVSLTTDDLCFAAPDASNLKSILRTPSSTPRKRQTRLSSSTDDLITESLPPFSHSSPVKHTSPSRQGVRFQIKGDVHKKDNPRESESDNFVSENQAHRDYIRQLMKDIEESESVVTSSSAQDLRTRDMQEWSNTKTSMEQQAEVQSDVTWTEDGNMADAGDALNYYAEGYESQNDHFGYLEKIRRLLATPPPDEEREPIAENLNASQNTEDVLNGDRSWEKKSSKFQGIPCRELTDGLSVEQNIIDQFLEECKGNVDTTMSGGAPPGSMEALKNMLFTIQTLVPPGELSEHQENSFSSVEASVKQPSGNQNTVPENLRHLLASDSDLENSVNNGNSLSVAMQHLDTLKTLMDSRRLPQMTSTPK